MTGIYAMPLSAFLLLMGLVWNVKPLTPPSGDEDDPEAAETAYRKARRNRAIVGVVRIAALVFGGLLLLVNILAGLGSVQNQSGFAILAGVYGVMILAVQRSEKNRRLATLFISTPLWLVILPRFAGLREYDNELKWGIAAALVLNYLFWQVIGRRYPPGSSEDIIVWGMDE